MTEGSRKICIDFVVGNPIAVTTVNWARLSIYTFLKLGFTVSQVCICMVCNVPLMLTFIRERLSKNEISVGKMSCCHEAHSSFIDHNTLQIIGSFACSSHNYSRASLLKCFYIQTPITLATGEGAWSSTRST